MKIAEYFLTLIVEKLDRRLAFIKALKGGELARYLRANKTFNYRVDLVKLRGKRKRRTLHTRRLISRHMVTKFAGLISAHKLRFYVRTAWKSQNIFGKFLNFIESRFDTILHRLHFVPWPASARQRINHGLFTLNGRINPFPSAIVRLFDVVSVKNRIDYFSRFLRLLYVGTRQLSNRKIRKINYQLKKRSDKEEYLLRRWLLNYQFCGVDQLWYNLRTMPYRMRSLLVRLLRLYKLKPLIYNIPFGVNDHTHRIYLNFKYRIGIFASPIVMKCCRKIMSYPGWIEGKLYRKAKRRDYFNNKVIKKKKRRPGVLYRTFEVQLLKKFKKKRSKFYKLFIKILLGREGRKQPHIYKFIKEFFLKRRFFSSKVDLNGQQSNYHHSEKGSRLIASKNYKLLSHKYKYVFRDKVFSKFKRRRRWKRSYTKRYKRFFFELLQKSTLPTYFTLGEYFRRSENLFLRYSHVGIYRRYYLNKLNKKKGTGRFFRIKKKEKKKKLFSYQTSYTRYRFSQPFHLEVNYRIMAAVKIWTPRPEQLSYPFKGNVLRPVFASKWF
jgi:ribosomal protein S4